MSEASTPAAGASPSSTQEAPKAAPAAAPAAPAAPAATSAEPSFINERVDRAKRSVLKDLGIKVKKGEDPAKKIEEFKASKEERKKQRAELSDKVTQHEATIEKLSASEAAVKVYSDVEFKALTAAQQDIVAKAAGDDPAERLRVIAIMKATAPAKTEEPAKAAEGAKPLPAPAQTSPAVGAPEAGTSNPADVRGEYSRIAKTNPLLAAAYLLQNRHDYYTKE